MRRVDLTKNHFVVIRIYKFFSLQKIPVIVLGYDQTLLGANKQVDLETTIIRISGDQNSERNHKRKTLVDVSC